MVGMPKADNVTPLYLMAVLPEFIKDSKRAFFKPSKDLKKNLDYVAISVYPAKNSEKQPIIRKDGTQVMNATVYAGFTDGTYTSLKSSTAIAQAMAIMDDLDLNIEGVYEAFLEKDEYIPTGFTQVSEKMGKKEYDYWCFDPQ